jgi:hypothetical protein
MTVVILNNTQALVLYYQKLIPIIDIAKLTYNI